MAAEILAQMHDIEGLDPINCWPIASGWWIILTALMALIISIISFCRRRKKYRNSWMYLVFLNLANLERDLDTKPKKYIIAELSENLRQIAVQKYPREDCASLSGDAWIQWLEAHDPKRFPWTKHGEVVVLGPYAPNLENINNTEIKLLLNAAKRWVK